MDNPAITLLQNLVAIPSPSRHEGAAASFLVEWFKAQGLEAFLDKAGNAIGVNGSGDREIILLSHIDTFPGELPVRLEDGILHGRGSVDAKGSLCAFSAAIVGLTVPAGWKVTVVGAVEEEAATSKGARQVIADREEKMPVYCIIGEPSRWDRMTIGYKGRLLVDANIRVPFSHSASGEDLPAEKGVDLWRSVQDFCIAFNEQQAAKSPFTSLTPALRSINSRDEGAYGEVDLAIGFRLPPGLLPATLRLELTNHLHQNFDLPVDCLFSGAENPSKQSKNNPLVRAFLQSIRADEGDPRFVVKTGTCDLNVVAPAWPETPILAYGPGDSALDHTPDEQLPISEYQRAVAVLRRVLQSLLGAEQ